MLTHTPSRRDALTEELFRRGTLMHLHVRRWTGVKKMRKEDLLMDEVDEGVLYLGHKKLLPKRSMEKLVTLEGRARSQFASLSLEFPLPGIRYVTFQALSVLLERLAPIQREFDQETAQLLEEYPRFMAEQLAALDAEAEKLRAREAIRRPDESYTDYRARTDKLDAWLEVQKQQNRSYYPTVDYLRPRFGISWRMFTIQALENQAQVTELNAEEVAAARAQLRRELQGWVNEAATEMHRQLGEAAANARELLERHGRLEPRNLRPLFAAFESFEAMDFTGASDFRRVVEDIRSRYLVTGRDGQLDARASADRLEDPERQRELRRLLGAVGQLAQEAVAQEAGVSAVGRVRDFGRVLDV